MSSLEFQLLGEAGYDGFVAFGSGDPRGCWVSADGAYFLKVDNTTETADLYTPS